MPQLPIQGTIAPVRIYDTYAQLIAAGPSLWSLIVNVKWFGQCALHGPKVESPHHCTFGDS